MSRIELKHASLQIPIFNSQHRSIKKTVLNFAIKNRIQVSDSGKTIVNALNDLSFTVEPKEKLGIIGRNGAGKSTLLRVLARVYKPTSGYAKIEGKIGSLISISLGIDKEATGLENIYLRAALLGISKDVIEQQLQAIIDFTELGDFINLPIRSYSTGMHMRLAFAVSTMIEPDILLMDEWLSVGDKSFHKKAEERLNALIAKTNILVLASHSRDLIERCCTKVLWLEEGRIEDFGTPSEICNKYFK